MLLWLPLLSLLWPGHCKEMDVLSAQCHPFQGQLRQSKLLPGNAQLSPNYPGYSFKFLLISKYFFATKGLLLVDIFIFETVSPVTPTDLELPILLALPPKCRDHRGAGPHLALEILTVCCLFERLKNYFLPFF